MASEDYIAVGKIGKPHGLSGAFRFMLFRNLKNKKKFPTCLTLEMKGAYQPWFVKNVEWTGFNEGIILFEEIASPEMGKQFSGRELFIREKDLSNYFLKDAQSVDYLIGYIASDEGFGELGFIEQVLENPGQILLSLHHKGKEILIPLVEDFVVAINKRKKEIVFNLPDGLIDL